jgi:hypothetical protein
LPQGFLLEALVIFTRSFSRIDPVNLIQRFTPKRKQLTFAEETLVFFASLRSNPLDPETPVAVRNDQLYQIGQLTDRVSDNPQVLNNLAWEAIPDELRQLFFLAGMSALGAAIESINQPKGE